MKEQVYVTPEVEVLNLTTEMGILTGSGEDLGKNELTFDWE